MDAGNHNDEGKTPPNYSAVERWFFEMSEGKPLTEGTHTLRPVHENGDYYFMETDDDSEIFLFECRKAEGWDAHIGGSGLLVYHLDWSMRPAGESTSAGKVVKAWDRWDMNEANARPDHQCIDLIEPDPEARQRYQTAVKNRNYAAIYALASHAFWPFEDISVYTCDTDPSFTFWSDAASPLGLTDIRRKRRRKRHFHRLQRPGGQGSCRENRQPGRLPGRLHHPVEQPGPVLYREQRDPLRPGRCRPADRGRSQSL
jgi:hypothetical protein